MLSRLKGQSRIHRLRKRSSWHILGLPGSTVIGMTRWGGSTLPTSPQTGREPFNTLSRIVRVTKSWKQAHEGKLGKLIRGGSQNGMNYPWRSHGKGQKNSSTLTPSVMYPIISEAFGWPFRTTSKKGEQDSRLPAKKLSGAGKRNRAGEAETIPCETISINGKGPAQLTGLPSQSHHRKERGFAWASIRASVNEADVQP